MVGKMIEFIFIAVVFFIAVYSRIQDRKQYGEDIKRNKDEHSR